MKSVYTDCAPETGNSVKSLFQSIAKAMSFLYISGWFNLPLESLSRMMGNYHVRFLGDKGGVIRLRYPTKDEVQRINQLINANNATKNF